jgi:Domain of unknown function (DUF4396)
LPPGWLTVLSWASLALAVGSAGWIAADIYGRGYRQPTGIMEAVRPVTALYFGPLAVAAYRTWGRPASGRWRREHGDPLPEPGYAAAATAVAHCGAGFTLGDIIAEFAVFGLGASVAGLTPGAGCLATTWPPWSWASSSGTSPSPRFAACPCARADRGGQGRHCLADRLRDRAVRLDGPDDLRVLPGPHHLHPDSPVGWFGMQIGMIAGFFTAWPVNTWLIRNGVTEAM